MFDLAYLLPFIPIAVIAMATTYIHPVVGIVVGAALGWGWHFLYPLTLAAGVAQ